MFVPSALVDGTTSLGFKRPPSFLLPCSCALASGAPGGLAGRTSDVTGRFPKRRPPHVLETYPLRSSLAEQVSTGSSRLAPGAADLANTIWPTLTELGLCRPKSDKIRRRAPKYSRLRPMDGQILTEVGQLGQTWSTWDRSCSEGGSVDRTTCRKRWGQHRSSPGSSEVTFRDAGSGPPRAARDGPWGRVVRLTCGCSEAPFRLLGSLRGSLRHISPSSSCCEQGQFSS